MCVCVCVCLCVCVIHQPGRPEITREGWPVWHTSVGRVTLCQFRNNILTATDAAPPGQGCVYGTSALYT